MCRFKHKKGTNFYNFVKVSIHPMCRFKPTASGYKHIPSGFQYILCVGSSGWQAREYYYKYSFNTSYVSVQVTEVVLESYLLWVSIHPMCRFKVRNENDAEFFNWVSIHPMCRFKVKSLLFAIVLTVVSIHPMCRFKLCLHFCNLFCFLVSIHPMCRFKQRR